MRAVAIVEVDPPVDALLFGANTEANRKRFWEASRVFHHLELTDPKTGRYVTMGHAPANGRVVSLGAPFWWRGKGEGQQWSLTGRLFGPRFDSHRGSGGARGARAFPGAVSTRCAQVHAAGSMFTGV